MHITSPRLYRCNLPHNGLAPPLLLDLTRSKVRNLGLDVSRGDSVHTGEASPFDSQALAYKYDGQSLYAVAHYNSKTAR